MRQRSLIGAALLGALALGACNRAGAKAQKLRGQPLLEGRGLSTLVIDQTTLAEAALVLGVDPKEASRPSQTGAIELHTPLLKLAFLPGADDPSVPRLYAITATLKKDGQLGKTEKGVGPLDPRSKIEEAYGPPQGEWVQMNQRLLYYEQGVIFTVQHPKQMNLPPGDYEALCKELDQQPKEEPSSTFVTAIMVVRPFSVLAPAERAVSGQRVVSGPPETDLRVSAF